MVARSNPDWLRVLDVIFGLIAISIATVVIIFPAIAIGTLVFWLFIILAVVGVGEIVVGATEKRLSKGLRALNILAGIAGIILAMIAVAFPVIAAETLVLMIAFGLLFFGIVRMAIGFAVKILPTWIRTLVIVVGLLSVFFALIVIFFPVIGIASLIVLLSFTFLLLGIEYILLGVTGRK